MFIGFCSFRYLQACRDVHRHMMPGCSSAPAALLPTLFLIIFGMCSRHYRGKGLRSHTHTRKATKQRAQGEPSRSLRAAAPEGAWRAQGAEGCCRCRCRIESLSMDSHFQLQSGASMGAAAHARRMLRSPLARLSHAAAAARGSYRAALPYASSVAGYGKNAVPR